MDNLKNKRLFNRLVSLSSITIPLGFLLLPILGLLFGAASEKCGQDILSLILPSSRSLTLFIRSILLSGAISAASLFIALASSLGLYKAAYKYERAANILCYISIFMLLLPSFIHSQGWWKALEAVGLPPRGMFPSWWVSVMYFLPLPLMLIFISLKALDRDVLEAGAVFLNPERVLLRVILPSIYPAVFGSGLLVFLLSLADYSIPSIFSINVYSLDIFAQFSVSGSVSDALFYSLPLILFTALLGIVGFWMLHGLSLTAKGEKGKGYVLLLLPKPVFILSALGLFILFISIITPLAVLISGLAGGGAVEHISTSIGEFANTIFISFSTLLISVPLSLILGGRLSSGRVPWIVYFILALPLIMPSALTGIGLIGIFNRTTLYNTAAMPVLASVIRYTPVGAILCYSGFKGLDREVLSARSVYQKSVLDGFIKLLLPMILPTALMAGFIAFILSTGEIGATIMVLPPGFNTLAVKIYNYLHYGSSEAVAVLCSVLAVFAAAAAGIGFITASLMRKGRD